MTVRVSQLRYADEPDYGWLPDGDLAVSDTDILSLIRHIMRERNDISIMPIINGVIGTDSLNQYGHNVFIDVTYSRNGWRATYAGKIDGSGVSNVQCYMD